MLNLQSKIMKIGRRVNVVHDRSRRHAELQIVKKKSGTRYQILVKYCRSHSLKFGSMVHYSKKSPTIEHDYHEIKEKIRKS